MNAIVKPIGFGVAAYVVSAIGLWFVMSYLLFPLMPGAIWLLPAMVTLVPLFLSGYVGARLTVSRHLSRRVAFGVVAGLIGYGISLVVTQARGEIWFFGLFLLGAAVVAAFGGFLGARQRNAL